MNGKPRWVQNIVCRRIRRRALSFTYPMSRTAIFERLWSKRLDDDFEPAPRPVSHYVDDFAVWDHPNDRITFTLDDGTPTR